MTSPRLDIDLDAIEHNTRTVCALCSQHGIAVTGVTKVVCGHPEVARAMLRGGVVSIADSRLANLRRLRRAGVAARFMLLRIPALSAVDEVVQLADLSLNSELRVLDALSAAARRIGRVHDVILMVDLGDLREGIWPDDLIPFVQDASVLPGIRIVGLGANLACFAGVVPSTQNMNLLARLAEEVEQTLGIQLELLSGVNSSGLKLIASGRMPSRINHARIGEAIVLGRETIRRRPWPGTRQDACTLYAEVLELKRKPSAPIGERGEDAFGGRPEFRDRGQTLRALLNLGREDVDVTGLVPLDPGLRILGASSGYLLVDVDEAETPVRVGDELAFLPNYSALLAAMTSEYVKKRPLGGEMEEGPPG